MLTLSRRPKGSDAPRRSRGALAVSIAVNALVVAVFVDAVNQGLRWRDLLPFDRASAVTERVRFVQPVPPQAAATPVAGRSGGDGRPVSERSTPSRPRPVAPTTVPEAIAPADPKAAPTDGGGSGPVVGTGGATVGIQPSYGDSRLWGRPTVQGPRNARERMDSVIADTFGPVRDSILAEREALAGQRKPGDWTVKGPGGKWGIDQQSIHLGKISIPNAILALLSENVQQNLRGNPTQAIEDRRMGLIRADLLQHAQREQNEDMFRSSVKEIRARKDRERAVRLAEQRPLVADPDKNQDRNRDD